MWNQSNEEDDEDPDSHDHDYDHDDGDVGVDDDKKSFVTKRLAGLLRTCVQDTSHPGDTSFKYHTFNSKIFLFIKFLKCEC